MTMISSWKRRLLRTPQTIDCVQMKLTAPHSPDPLFDGCGQIEINDAASISFKMYGTPIEQPEFAGLIEGLFNMSPASARALRLTAIDRKGQEFNCGYTEPRFFHGNPRWIVKGWLSGLTTAASEEPSGIQQVQLIYPSELSLQFSEPIARRAQIGDDEVALSSFGGRHLLSVGGADFEFVTDPDDGYVVVNASGNDDFHHPYLENWISEPLRILLGQIIAPRLITRTQRDGSAMVSMRAVPELRPEVNIASLFCSTPAGDRKFWDLYRDLLIFIASDLGNDGHPNFESNFITRYYEDLILAARSSRRMVCFALASACEALSQRFSFGSIGASEYDDEDLGSLLEHVKTWRGVCESNPGVAIDASDLEKRKRVEGKLRDRIISSIGYYKNRSPMRILSHLADLGKLTQENVAQWGDTRHRVMHGSLVTPWATEEGDTEIRRLAALMHELTLAIIEPETMGPLENHINNSR